MYQDTDAYRGLVLGIQENTANEEHECYQSYLTLEDATLALADYAEQYYNNVENTYLPDQYNYGLYAKYGKKGMEVMILFYDFYE